MKTKILSCRFLLLLSLTVERGSTALPEFQSQQILQFDVEHASFRSSDGRVLLEVYYSFPHSSLEFVNRDSQQVAVFQVAAQFFRGDSLVHSREWFGKTALDGDEELGSNQSFYTLSRFILEPGQYRLVTKIRDTNAQIEGLREIELDLRDFSRKILDISDVELATSVSKDSTNGAFTKNGYRAIPNASRVYGLENPMLYFYAEIYNLGKEPNSTYSVEYSILADRGETIRTYPPRVRPKVGASVVETGGVNVVSLQPGAYFLNLKVTDRASESVVSRRKRFFVAIGSGHEASLALRRKADLHAYYENATLDQIDEEFESATHLSTADEKRTFATLNLEEKRAYLVEFWWRRDETVQSDRGEFWPSHLARLNYAKTHYEGRQKGWRSDRGRVVIKYGQPDEVEKNFSLSGKKSYEIWHYYTYEGGLMFVFVEKGPLTELELVHSTAPGELFDPDWTRWIQF